MEPEIVGSANQGWSEVWVLPTDESFLYGLLEDLFINLLDGYMTVHFGGTHFHLCIGDNLGTASNPTPDHLRRHRRPSRAEFFRGLDRQGAPINWGFRMVNGMGEPQITIFFPNPFLTDDDGIAEVPDWSRLAVWETVARRYLDRDPDPRDRTGRGFRHG